MSTEAPYSIGSAAEAAGLNPQTVRIWEERYGKPVAHRLPSGHRRYTEAQVRWLRRIAEALQRGHRPSAVIPLGEKALSRLLDPSEDDAGLSAQIERVLGWVRAYDAHAVRAWLRAQWAASGPLPFLRDDVAPLIFAVGRQWADGELEVQHEHFLSEILEDELRRLRLAMPTRQDGARVILATLPGELHGLGLQMVALLAANQGAEVHLLGPDTPLSSIVATSRQIDAAVVAISVSVRSGTADTNRALAELRSSLDDDTRIIAGGSGMQRARRAPRGVEVATDLEAWDALVRTFAGGR